MLTAIFNDENGVCIFIQTDLKTMAGYIRRARLSKGEFTRVKSIDFYRGDNRPYYNQNTKPYKTVSCEWILR